MVNVNKIALSAAKRGDIDEVRTVISHGASNINQIGLASSTSDNNTISLVSNVITLGVHDSYMNMISAQLAEKGHKECINFSKNNIHTALHACKTDRDDIIKLYLDIGLTVDEINQLYFFARKYNARKVLKLLNTHYEEPLDVLLYVFDDDESL